MTGLSVLMKEAASDAPGVPRNRQETSVRGINLTRRLHIARRAAIPGAFSRRAHRTAIQGRRLPMGALAIAVVSATALAPASTQALNWSIVPSPNISPAKDDNVLDAVSCASPTSCMAAGYYYGRSRHGTPESALAETWNGTSWSAIPTPRPVNSALYGVSCTSARACVAVGSSELSPNYTQIQLVEIWNGTRWSIMPVLAHIASDFYAVSCVSATDCTAVGDQGNFASGRYLTFIESWNGHEWSTVPSPNAGAGDNFLTGVSCLSASACTAVGVQYRKSLASGPLIESWNGKRWSIVPAPNKAGSGELDAVSCVSADACVAVGTYLSKASAANMPLIESWSGSRWSIEPVNGPQSELFGVSCVSASTCKAAGNDWNKSFNAQTFVESWNGTRWSTEPTPNAGSPARSANILRAVSCASASFCATVGNYGPVAS